MKLGAWYSGSGKCDFTVWAPFVNEMSLRLEAPAEKVCLMRKDDRGYWHARLEDLLPGALYSYLIDGRTERPDPASFYQPAGVHRPSRVVDHSAFQWNDREWKGIPPAGMIIYEIHIGTFTPEGTFAAAVPFLDELTDIGINAVEIMPVAQFPGERNWGYDGAYPFAVQDSYGGPDGLKTLVNECHKRGMAVILDVVYNHLGPEGNYLRDFGPYFTARYQTPWGEAINFDDAYSNEVREYFIRNALYWFEQYHIDALRLDAVHGIYDNSARHFLLDLSVRVKALSREKGREFYLIAESDLNDPLIVKPEERGGFGLDGLWCDDFHHALHVLLTGESAGYYIDFGKTEQLAKSLAEGFVFSGEYSRYRKRNHGNSSADLPAGRFVVFAQNHDQVGNRMMGERLAGLVSFEALKLAAGTVILSPYIPLLFMGEEYGETAPFCYFVSHSDPDLIDAVREGRKQEFSAFGWDGEPPDPLSEETFLMSRPDRKKIQTGDHKVLRDLYRELIRLRKETPALARPDRDCLEITADEDEKIISVRRWASGNIVRLLFNFNKEDAVFRNGCTDTGMVKLIESSDTGWNGPGAWLPGHLEPGAEFVMRRQSFALFVNKGAG